VDWLGEVPAHWDVWPLKRAFDVCLGKMLQTEQGHPAETLLPYLRAANIQWSGVDASDIKTMWFSPRERKTLSLAADDLLVSEGGDVGRACLWRGELPECAIQNSVNRVRARGPQSTAFLRYWMWAIKEKGYIDVLCNKSTIPHFTAEKVAAVPVPSPPYTEQRIIATYLDRETARIDALVSEQQRLIALLQEKRRAVISHAVTRGIHPDARMKPSGVPCLGDVPEHWQIRTVASVSTKITNGYVGPTRDILVDGGVRYLQSLHIKDNAIRFDVPYFVTKEWSLNHGKSILESGDVLIVQTGDIGQVTVVTDAFAGSNCHALIVVAPKRREVKGEWLSWCLNSAYGRHSLLSIQTGALHPHLNCGNVRGIMVPLPPLEEQARIVDVINEGEAQFGDLITEAEKAIALLGERRASLISAAVTGKIDVRDLVGALAA
jgi:type I restriction enzyme, S subunit